MNTSVDPELYHEVAKFGARDMEICPPERIRFQERSIAIFS
jgi:hypothetical protein